MPRPLPVIELDTTACCPPLIQAPLTADDATVLAGRLKALADPHRLRVVSLLLASPEGQACTCDLTEPLGLSQPTVTHHLKKLLEAGIVTAERRGVWTYYTLVPESLSALMATLDPTRS